MHWALLCVGVVNVIVTGACYLHRLADARRRDELARHHVHDTVLPVRQLATQIQQRQAQPNAPGIRAR